MANINYTATADLKSFSTWLTNNVDQNASTWDSTTQEGVLVLNSGVTSIGQSAFEGCTDLLIMTLPNEIRQIGFKSFQQCSNLTSITFGNNLTSISSSSFNECTSLTSITLPNSLTTLSNQDSFRNCTSLTSITFGNNLQQISNSVFSGCTSLTSITLPNSLKTLRGSAFNGCTNLTTFTIPDSVNDFENCFTNTSWWNSQSDGIIYKDNWCLGYKGTAPTGNLIIQSSTKGIGTRAFRLCSELTAVTFPDSLTIIGDSAFNGCTSLTEITIPENITRIGSYSFAGTNITQIYWNAISSEVYGTTSPTYSPFASINSNFSITVGSSAVMLPNYFCNITGNKLTSLNFENATSLTTIGNSAFQGCTGLTSITLPASLTNITQYAFYSCNNLLSVTSLATTPPTLASYNFQASGDTLKVLPSALSAYQNNASWSAAFTNIEAIPVTIHYTATADLMTSPTSWMTNNVASSTYDSTTQEGTLTLNAGVTTITDNAFSQKTTLTSIIFPDGLTSLGGWLFFNCTNLLSISIPASVSVIGNAISMGCTKLASITIDSNNTYYDSRDNCNAVIETSTNTLTAGCKNTIIPSTVTSIGGQAFYGCTGLTGTISLINCTSIGNAAFQGCSNITTVLLPTGISINSSVFFNCTRLSSIDLSTVTSIGTSAFQECTGLSGTISLINCTSIGENAFQNCTRISGINLSNNLTTIGRGAFVCGSGSQLQSIYIPASVTSIGSTSYGGKIVSPTVSSIVVDSNNTYYDSRDNCNCIIETATDRIIQGCVNSTIPNSIKIIGYQALAACQFTNLVIPEGVTTIESYGLQSNTKLVTLKLPSTLTLMMSYATEYCGRLLNVYCYATTPPTLYGSNFTSVSGDTLYVPVASKSAYQSATNWSTAFTNYVGLCEVTSTVTGSGSVSPSSATVNEGDDVTLTITPDEGYGIFSVIDNGTSVPVTRTGMTYTISNIAADHAIAVVFKPLFTITTSASTGGTITPTTEVLEGESFTVTATPNAHYKVSHFIVDGVDVGTVDNYTFQNLDADHTIHVDFELITHTITATAYEGGAIVPSGAITVNEGENQSFDIVPLEEYGILAVFIDGTQIEPVETYTFTDVEADHTIDAMFYPLRVAGFNRDEMLDIDYLLQDYLEQLKKRD